MTSSINPNNINGSYPVAGQDNDSQGFRDNFTNIKNNFTNAKGEIEDLQSKAILKSALSGGTLSNDLNYSQLVSAQLLKTVETKVDLGTQNGTLPVSWADGHFQYFATNGDVTLGFSGWPTNSTYAKMRLEIKTDSSARTITFPSAVDTGLSDIQGASGQVLTLPAGGTYLFELTTYNNGTNVTIQDLLRNYSTVATTFNNTTISGNLTIAGGRRDTGYLHIGSPASDFSTQANVGISRVVIDPSATIAKGTLTLPPGNVDATIVTVSSTADITAFAIKGYGNVVVKPSANVTLAAGTSVEYFYKADEWKWYKVR
jgi:hypothetical protein